MPALPATLYDRVMETTTTTGTGTITLAGAVTQYRSFSVVGTGNPTIYCIEQQVRSVDEWEVGIGTYTSAGTTLSRTTVLASSNGGSLVNFSAGTKNVFIPNPAARANYGSQVIVGTGSTQTGTITVPDWATWIQIEGIRAGDGGGGGRRGASGTMRNGGNGGDGGPRGGILTISLVDLGTRALYYSVGAWGSAGAGATADNTNGSAGGMAAALEVKKDNSSGDRIYYIPASTVSGGRGGDNASAGPGANGNASNALYCEEVGGIGGQAAANASQVNPTSTYNAGAGGGFGYSMNASNVLQNLSLQGVANHNFSVTAGTTNNPLGGDGGVASSSTQGANGVDGYNYGGGGSGGNYSNNGTNGGTGGRGGAAILRVMWW